MVDRFICRTCGAEHSILESLAPECLAAVVPATEAEIDAALERGRRERAAYEAAEPTWPGWYR